MMMLPWSSILLPLLFLLWSSGVQCNNIRTTLQKPILLYDSYRSINPRQGPPIIRQRQLSSFWAKEDEIPIKQQRQSSFHSKLKAVSILRGGDDSLLESSVGGGWWLGLTAMACVGFLGFNGLLLLILPHHVIMHDMYKINYIPNPLSTMLLKTLGGFSTGVALFLLQHIIMASEKKTVFINGAWLCLPRLIVMLQSLWTKNGTNQVIDTKTNKNKKKNNKKEPIITNHLSWNKIQTDFWFDLVTTIMVVLSSLFLEWKREDDFFMLQMFQHFSMQVLALSWFIKSIMILFQPKSSALTLFQVDNIDQHELRQTKALLRGLGNEMLCASVLTLWCCMGTKSTILLIPKTTKAMIVQVAGSTSLLWVLLLSDMAFLSKTWRYMDATGPWAQLIHIGFSALFALGFLINIPKQ